MSWIDLIVERQIQEAIERAALQGGAYHGKPLPDADVQRPQGWWAEQFVRRERSRIVREDHQDDYDAWRPTFWRAGTEGDLDELLLTANRRVADINADLIPEDAFTPFDADAVRSAWRALHGR